MQIITVRPDATAFIFGAVVTGAATAHAALSDDSDASYVTLDTLEDRTLVTAALAASAAGFSRHRFQVEVRKSASTPWALYGQLGSQVNLQSGGPQGGFPTPTNNTGPWGFVPTFYATNSTLLSWNCLLNPGSSDIGEVRYVELWGYVDEREPPAFTAEVHDGAGVNRDAGIISDTSRPTFVWASPDYDGLTARTWSLEVRTVPGGVVVYTASGNGQPTNLTIDSLPNGDYEADLQIVSTIRTNDAYASDVETVTFEIAFVPPASPAVTATVVPNPPTVELDWVTGAPTATTWDVDDDVVTEIRRTDCNGTRTFYVEQTGLGASEFTDRFMSLSYNGVFCDEEDHDCEVCYEARYWGLVDDVLVATDWSTSDCVTVTNPTPGNAWIRGAASGSQSVCPDESFGSVRPFGVFQPIGGGIPTVITGSPGGRNYSLGFTVTFEADLVSLEAILAQALVFYQPVEQADIWLAPNQGSGVITKVNRIRTLSIDTVAVNPQPVTDPASFF